MLGDNAKDTDELDTISWGHFVSQLAIHRDNERARHLTCWNQLWRLLQLKRLLVKELALFGDDSVRVEWAPAALITQWGRSVCALPSGLGATKAVF